MSFLLSSALPHAAPRLALGALAVIFIAGAWAQSTPALPASASTPAPQAAAAPAGSNPASSGAPAPVRAARTGTVTAAPRPPASTPGAAPFARGEALHYNVNWPSGLSLGEAEFKVGGAEPGWDFEFNLDASLPGFDIKDHYRSSADAQFCSQRLEKDSVHGPRKSKETITYDQQKHDAKRKTDTGGESELSVPDCVKDGLAFLYYIRRELAAGRLPAAQTVNFGSAYQVSVTYGAAQQMEIGGVAQTADRIAVSFRGPASSHTFEAFFARDAARTPLVIRVPFSLGTFSLELAR